MYTLIFIFAVKTQFNTSIDVKQFATFNTMSECTESANRIIMNMKLIEPDIKAQFICEKK